MGCVQLVEKKAMVILHALAEVDGHAMPYASNQRITPIRNGKANPRWLPGNSKRSNHPPCHPVVPWSPLH